MYVPDIAIEDGYMHTTYRYSSTGTLMTYMALHWWRTWHRSCRIVFRYRYRSGYSGAPSTTASVFQQLFQTSNEILPTSNLLLLTPLELEWPRSAMVLESSGLGVRCEWAALAMNLMGGWINVAPPRIRLFTRLCTIPRLGLSVSSLRLSCLPSYPGGWSRPVPRDSRFETPFRLHLRSVPSTRHVHAPYRWKQPMLWHLWDPPKNIIWAHTHAWMPDC